MPAVKLFAARGCCAPAGGSRPGLSAQVAWLQCITLGWMTVECAVSLLAARRAHSAALLAFGSDSLVELFSAVVVLLQFLPRFPLKKEYAARAAAVLLFVLAAAVVGIAVLGYRTPGGNQLPGHWDHGGGAGGDAGAGMAEAQAGSRAQRPRPGRGCGAIGHLRVSGGGDPGGTGELRTVARCLGGHGGGAGGLCRFW